MKLFTMILSVIAGEKQLSDNLRQNECEESLDFCTGRKLYVKPSALRHRIRAGMSRSWEVSHSTQSLEYVEIQRH